MFATKNQPFCGVRSATLGLTTLVVLAAVLGGRLVWASGLGENLLWTSGSLLKAEFERRDPNSTDALFKRVGPPSASELKFVDTIKRIHVQVVAPAKDLASMMSVASTKSRALFLNEYETYFGNLNIGSTSRPMLMAYLGLELVGDERLRKWYEPFRRRASFKIVDSCSRLIEQRAELMSHLSEEEVSTIEEARKDKSNKFELAYLVFQNNVNLFMLESYLLLCTKLEPTELGAHLALF